MQKQITSRQREFISRFVREYKTFGQWADELGVNISTITRWRVDFSDLIDQEKAIADKELKDKFENVRDQAFSKMVEHLEHPNPKIASQAWKYILDHAGYNGTKKIDITDKTQDVPFTPAEIATIKAYILSDETENQ